MSESNVDKLKYFIPDIGKCHGGDEFLDAIITHIEELEGHLTRIRNAHDQLYKGTGRTEAALTEAVRSAISYLDRRTERRRN